MEIDRNLAPCPICGSPAFVMHDVVDGFEFGYSVGCPRACIDDPVHKLGEEDFINAKLVMHGFITKQAAIKAWNKRASCSCDGG